MTELISKVICDNSFSNSMISNDGKWIMFTYNDYVELLELSTLRKVCVNTDLFNYNEYVSDRAITLLDDRLVKIENRKTIYSNTIEVIIFDLKYNKILYNKTINNIKETKIFGKGDNYYYFCIQNNVKETSNCYILYDSSEEFVEMTIQKKYNNIIDSTIWLKNGLFMTDFSYSDIYNRRYKLMSVFELDEKKTAHTLDFITLKYPYSYSTDANLALLSDNMYVPLGYSKETKSVIYDKSFAEKYPEVNTDNVDFIFCENHYYIRYKNKYSFPVPIIEVYDYDHVLLNTITDIEKNMSIYEMHDLLILSGDIPGVGNGLKKIYYGDKLMNISLVSEKYIYLASVISNGRYVEIKSNNRTNKIELDYYLI